MARLASPWRVRVQAARLLVDGISLHLSHPEKVLWPGEEITKRDLAMYYLAVAPVALPYLAERPLTLHTFPQGIAAAAAYVKQRPRGTPPWVRQACLPARAGHTVCYVTARMEPAGAATLVWLANYNSIPLHTWLSRSTNPERPDWVAFDLDPAEGATFAQVTRIARWLAGRLAHLRLRSFVKTSGSRGLHILVPLAPEYGYDEVRSFAEAIAREVVQALPDDATLLWPLHERRGSVFVDVRRNSYGATLVAPYSVRARPGAPVSTPLDWEELDDPGLSPTAWNIHSILDRLRRQGDPLAAALTLHQQLPAAPRA